MQATNSTFKSPSPPLFLLESSDGKVATTTNADRLAVWSPGPDSEVEEGVIVDSGMQHGADHDSLEDVYAGVDSLLDTTANGHAHHAGNNVVEEDDPLAEFEAWIASGAVLIVDKL